MRKTIELKLNINQISNHIEIYTNILILTQYLNNSIIPIISIENYRLNMLNSIDLLRLHLNYLVLKLTNIQKVNYQDIDFQLD